MIELNTCNIVLIWALLSLTTCLPLMWLENKDDEKNLFDWEFSGWLLWAVISLIWPVGMVCIIVMTSLLYFNNFKIGLLKKRTFSVGIKNTTKVIGNIIGWVIGIILFIYFFM